MKSTVFVIKTVTKTYRVVASNSDDAVKQIFGMRAEVAFCAGIIISVNCCKDDRRN